MFVAIIRSNNVTVKFYIEVEKTFTGMFQLLKQGYEDVALVHTNGLLVSKVTMTFHKDPELNC